MLTIFSGQEKTQCNGMSRRDFISVGSLALGSLSLPQLLSANQTGYMDRRYIRDRSVVLLYLSGGASQIETFDPKPNSRTGIGSVNGSHATRVAGIRLGGAFPGLAERFDQMAIIRSFHHAVGSHEQAHVHVLTGGTDPRGDQKNGYSMGSLVSRLRGASHLDSGMPTYSLLTEKEVDGQYRSELSRVRKGSHAGELGQHYAPFEPAAGGTALSNMTLSVPAERFGERRILLSMLDGCQKKMENLGPPPTNKFVDQAETLLSGGGRQALDLSSEDPRLIQQYDTSHIPIGFKKFRPSTLGKQMLMARRLCESGCGFVTVHSAGWDMHADSNNPGMQVGMDMLGRSLDKAVSAFLSDVKRRGLTEKILLVITGDFGRTPKLNDRGGRDHWARLCPLALAGGGVQGGQAIGQSTRDAGEPLSDPYTTGHLLATVMHSLFDMGELRLQTQFPRAILQMLEKKKPIPVF